MLTLETLVVELAADVADYAKGLKETAEETESWAGKIGKLAGGAIVGGATVAATAIAGIGTAAMAAWGEFDEASDALIHSTGASGQALAAMEASVKTLYGTTAGLGVTMGDIGLVMGEVSKRTDLTGSDLEALTGQVMNFARMTGIDGVAATASLTRTMSAWGVESGEAGTILNQLYGAGQQFGISFDQLTAQLTKFGQPLQNMGFSLQESIGMLGLWQQQGVNSQSMLMGLSAASARFADDGISMQEGLRTTIDRIKGAATETEALGIAYETFGVKAGAEMVAAIQNGNLELDAATAAILGTSTALDTAAEDVLDFPDQWEMSMNKIQVALVPLGTSLANLIGAVLPALVSGIEWVVAALTPFLAGLITLSNYIGAVVEDGDYLNDWLTHLPGPLQGVVQAIGQVIAWFQNLGTTIDSSGSGKFEYFKNWLDQNMPRIQQIVETVLGAIQTFWTHHGDAIMRVVGNTFETIWAVIDTALKTILDLVTLALQLLTGDWEGAGQTLQGIVERLWETIRTIFSNTLDSVRTLFADFDWGQLGRNIIEGIANGISAAGGRIVQAAQDAARSAYEAAKSWLGIHSPSKKAADEIGAPFAQGIGMGFTGGMGAVTRKIEASMAGLFGDISPTLQPAAAGAGGIGGGLNITVYVNGGGTYDTGRQVGRGIVDELRSRGIPVR